MSGQFYFSSLLTKFTVQRGIGEQGIGTEIAPIVNYDQLLGSYFKRDRQRLGSVAIKRAPGESVKRSQTGGGEMVPFIMSDHTLIKEVPMELVEGQSNQALWQELENATAEALGEIQFGLESDIHGKLWGANQSQFNDIYGSNQVTSPTIKWDAEGATMYADVQGKREASYKLTGKRPNIMVMTTEILNKIQSDPNNEIGERIKYTNGRIPQLDLLAEYFDVEKVLVPRNLSDGANIGKAANYDYMWKGDSIGLFYVDKTDSRNKVTLASTFVHENARRPFLGVFRRYNEENESHEVKVGAFWTVDTVDVGCGSILYNVLT